MLKKERVLDEDKGKAKTRLFFEDEVKKPKTQSKLTFEADKSVRKVGDTLASGIHGKIHEVEGDNSAVEAAHKTEILVESATRQYSHHKKQRNMNRHYQKSAIKKDYAAARKAGTQTAGKATAKTGKKTGEKVAEKVKEFIAKNKVAFMWIRIGLAALILFAALFSSCTAMFSSTGSAVIASSYLSEDAAMQGAEQQYCQMEADLQSDYGFPLQHEGRLFLEAA